MKIFQRKQKTSPIAVDTSTVLLGLQNPGKKYERTRHNAGALFVLWCAKQADVTLRPHTAIETTYVRAQTATGVQLFALPLTFMNTSGRAAQKLLAYFKLPPAQLIVAHDDLDLPLGTYKIQKNRSAAGHNGVQDLFDVLGTQDVWRVRIGVDNRTASERTHMPGRDYVLGRFNAAELDTLEQLYPEMQDALKRALQKEPLDP